MISIAICDDEKPIISQVHKIINDTSKDEKIGISVATYMNWETLEYDMSEKLCYDIIFMDIQFGDKDGILLAEKIKEKYPHTEIVFMTGFHDRVYDVFSVKPSGFVRKPIQSEDIKVELMRALDACKSEEMFEYVSNRVVYRVPLKEIVYICSAGRKIQIKMLNEDREYYGKLDDVECKLREFESCFYRISKSFLVNSRFVYCIKYDSVCVKVNDDIKEYKIAQNYRNGIKKKYIIDSEEE